MEDIVDGDQKAIGGGIAQQAREEQVHSAVQAVRSAAEKDPADRPEWKFGLEAARLIESDLTRTDPAESEPVPASDGGRIEPGSTPAEAVGVLGIA